MAARKEWERPAAMIAQFVNGRRFAPRMSGMQIAKFRKEAMINGKVKIGADYKLGEWDPRWEDINKPFMTKPPKGKKYLRNRDAKMQKIKDALETMDDQIKARSKKGTIPTPFLDKLFVKTGIVAGKKK